MSKIGEKPIPLPDGVEIELKGRVVRVKGPKGVLEREIHPDMRVCLEGKLVRVERTGETRSQRSLHGLTRTLIDNMITGVTKGYEKVLEVEGIGYRIQKKGDGLTVQLGFSSPMAFGAPKGVEFEVETVPRRADRPGLQCTVTVKGIDKELVGETAARLRSVRKPEPYKGTGIRYRGEIVRKKAGKRAV